MKQYDYQELIDEIKDEISAGSLTNTEAIQILRSEEVAKDGYKEIIDWYYNAETMDIELAPENSDSKEEVNDKMLIRNQYNQDKSALEVITVEACLAEMFGKTPPKTKKNRDRPFF